MSTMLGITKFGNPVLRNVAPQLNSAEIASKEMMDFVQAMFERLQFDDGVGLAAPQVGVSKALFVIDIHPNAYHPGRENFRAVVMNPVYEGIGRRASMWEGCLSSGDSKSVLFGKALRYRKILATYTDQDGVHHKEELNGLVAHVFQHETDHLNGRLFVDLVRDPSTYMTGDEYRKRILGKGSKS